MDYSGPEPADLANVHALNHALLDRLRDAHLGAGLRAQLGLSLQPQAAALTATQARRLASAPFLLATLREHDRRFWAQLFEADPAQGRLALPPSSPGASGSIVAATIGFVWQLAKRNPYTARLVCGASQQWCEQLAARPLVDVLRRAVWRDDLVGLRFAEDAAFWRRLLQAGSSSDVAIRSAAHLCALHAVLTDGAAAENRRLRAAACSTAVPTLRV